MVKIIDINCDMGEQRGDDKSIIKFISSANIACGGHAGTFETMQETIALAQKCGVSAGAHPGYPDKENFGRSELNIETPEIINSVLKQLSNFKKAADSANYKISHIKLHGALYNRASVNYSLMFSLTSAVLNEISNTPFYVLAGSASEKAVADAGGKFYSEAFSDRAYDSHGQLVSRKIKGAVLYDSELIAKRVLMIVEKGEVESFNRNIVKLMADTICVHGDTPGSVLMAEKINKVLTENRFAIRSHDAV